MARALPARRLDRNIAIAFGIATAVRTRIIATATTSSRSVNPPDFFGTLGVFKVRPSQSWMSEPTVYCPLGQWPNGANSPDLSTSPTLVQHRLLQSH